MVVIQHAIEQVFPAYLAWSTSHVNLGQAGVAAFMLVSGFIIPVSMERGGDLGRFWVVRFWRLYPLYWTMIGLMWLSYSAGQIDKNIPASAWLANLTMFQEFVGRPHVVGLFWTLTMEMAFYIFVSVAFQLKVLGKSQVIHGAMLSLVAVAAIAVPLVLGRRVPGGYMFLFCLMLLGTVVYRAFSGAISWRKAGWSIAAMAVVAVPIAYVNFLLFPRVGNEFSMGAMLWSWLAGAAVFFGLLTLRNRKMPKAVTELGVVSYSLYLMHPLVLTWMPKELPGWLYATLVITFSVALAFLTYRLVEKPALTFCKTAIVDAVVPTGWSRRELLTTRLQIWTVSLESRLRAAFGGNRTVPAGR